LDIVISNAGITGEVVPIVEYPSAGFARTLAMHVLGAFHVLKQTIPQGTLYLAADKSAMVTSTTFSIDGGMGG
jgi:hypothetical protein